MLWVVYDQGFLFVVTRLLEHRSACQSVFIAGKSEIFHFFKNDTPSHSKITSNFTTFGSFYGAISDSESFLDHNSASIMSSKLLHGTIALQQSDLECLK